MFGGHHAKRFESEEEFKERICSMWNQCATNVELLRKEIKQFLSCSYKRRKINQICLAKLCSAINKIYKKRRFSVEMYRFSCFMET